MRIVNKEIEVYKFNELSEEIQNKIIEEEIEVMLDTTDYSKLSHNSNLYKAIKECEKMQTPWFITSYVYDYCGEKILKHLNKLEFTKNGNYFQE